MEKLKDPRRRKTLLVLPLLIIPFLTMAFWALGGGKGDTSSLQKRAMGLNLQLPNPQLKDDKGENKLSYYEEAEKDSVKWREDMENDPLFPAGVEDSSAKQPFDYNPYPQQTADYKDPNEQKVYQKLAELNQHLQSPSGYNNYNGQQNSSFPAASDGSLDKTDVDHLEQMITKTSSPSEKDPEVDQLNSMMDRILDIQHPERVKQRLNENSRTSKDDVFSVESRTNSYSISLLDTFKKQDQPNGFYGIDGTNGKESENAIEAVIHETESLVDGSIVKIRLLDDVSIGETVIPKGSFVFGKAALEGERLQIGINSIRKDHSLFPVNLIVYDLDGMEGIHIPGAITRDVLKQSADNSLQNIEMSSFDPSLKAQAATAGINVAKSLLTKKEKLVKVTVKAGYKILLKEKETQ